MAIDKRTKLNRLLRQWPKGTVSVASFLVKEGFSRQLLQWYKRSGWLESHGHGAYVLPGDKIDWTGNLYALQKQLNMPVHVGGKTALELKGYGHFVPVKQKIFLYGERGNPLPTWFRAAMKESIYVQTNLFPSGYAEGLTDFQSRNFSVFISAPERAVMEMLHLVPKDVSFEEASLVFESLVGLRAELVQKLLDKCRYVKVKRLFLYLSERYSHDWFSRLKLNKVDLGKGNRMIAHGMLDKKYWITVPKPERESSE